MRTTKLLTAVLLVLLLTTAFANAKANNGKKRARPALSEAYVEQLLDDLKNADPEEAERLEKLRQEDPKAFHIEIRKLAWANRAEENDGEPMGDFEKFRQRQRMHRTGKSDMGPKDHGQMRGPENMEKGLSRRDRFNRMETEFVEWLEKNESAKAAELAELKEKNPQAYRRSLAIEMRKYRSIIDAEQSNPELATVLKKDLELKEQRNEILQKIRATTDDSEKSKLSTQLSEVIGQRFDIIVQKKQLKYESLQKKVEELKKEVEQNQAELDKFKSKKSGYIEERVEKLIEKSDNFDWN